MHYSAQNRESRNKDSTQNKKELKGHDRRIPARTGSNSKNSGKSTPKNSRDKKQAQVNKEKIKEDMVKSDYYSNENFSKNNKKRNSNSIIEDMSVSDKKSRRNMGGSKGKRQSTQFDCFNNSHLDQYQQRVLFQDSEPDCDSKLKSPILKKIKQLSSQGSIDFNGEIVRQSRLRTSQKNLGIGQITQQDYSGYQEKKNQKLKKSKGAGKSKSKSKGKQKSLKGQLKNKKKSSDSTKDLEKIVKSAEGMKKIKSLDEEQKYVISPYENPYKPGGPIEIAELQQEVQEDLENAYQYILSQELIKERGQCLNMLGKICSSMNLKRETFSAALSYIDSFIDINTEVKTIKTITIAALMMALKIDHAQMIGTGLQLSTISSMQSFTSLKAMSISTEARSQEKKGKRKDSNSKQNAENYDNSKQPKFNLNRPKLPNVLTTVLSHEEIFSEYDRILCKEEIMDMEMQMMVKLNFKLTIRSFTFWIDSLTSLWDTYILQSYSKLKSKVSFRTPECIKNLSYILGLVEVSYYFPYAYFYPKVILILSIMYLLVRIRIEYPADKEDKGFEHYRVNLGKSTNLIFVDKMGSNQLFGEFLAMLKLDMGDIVSCCQYVSHYFNSKILRVYSFQTNRSVNYEQHISAYHYNPEIYRFFQVKSGGVLNSACSHSEKAQVFF